MRFSVMDQRQAGEGVKKKQPRNWACRECGKRMTMAQADKAMSVGCPTCGGCDVDLLQPGEAPRLDNL